MKSLKFLSIVIIMTVILTACSAAVNGDLVVPTEAGGAKGEGITVVPEEGQTGGEMVTPPAQTQSPNESPSNPDKGPVYIDSYEVLSGKNTSELIIHLVGNLPDSCSKLKLTATADETANAINVLAFSSRPADMMCTQVLTPFDEKVTLSDLKDGKYNLLINGDLKESVTIPFGLITIQ